MPPMQKQPSEHQQAFFSYQNNNEEMNIEISYDFELFGFPKNALSLYGVDIGIFLSLPDDEKGNFLNEARMNYEERSKEISPELIQFLYDFEGNGFPPDALLKYGIDPLYFMEMPEEFKFAILDEAKKKYNQDMKQLLEKEKENERANNAKMKEKILLKRELALISEKGSRIMKEKRENLSENDWKELIEELAKLKDENIKANIYKRMSIEMINELPNEIRKVAYKFRRDLADFPNKESSFQEEIKENIEEPSNEKKFIEEIDNFFNSDDKNENKLHENIDLYEKIEVLLDKADFSAQIPIIPDKILYKLLQALVLINKKNPKIDEDLLFKTRYFLRTCEYLFKSPINAYKLLDGLMFLLNDYAGFIELINPEKDAEIYALFPILPNKERIEEIAELTITIIDFLTQLINKNTILPMIFKLKFAFSEQIRLDIANQGLKIEAFKELTKIREFIKKTPEFATKSPQIKSFLDIFFELLEKPDLENMLIDFTMALEAKLSVKDEKSASIIEKYPIIPIFLNNKQEMIMKLIHHPRFFEKHYLKSLVKLFVTEIGDFEVLLLNLLKLFSDKFLISLEETTKNIETFKLAHEINGNLKEIENEESRIALITTFSQEIVAKFLDFKSFSRGLKYLLARFRRLFKKSLHKHLLLNKDFDKEQWKDLELLRSWLREQEKSELHEITSSLRKRLETSLTVQLFKGIINNVDLLIDFIGDDCTQENSQVSAIYKVYKCGFKAFIYVYSFLNPLEEVEYESLEKEDAINEVPQLSKLLTLEVEDKKIKKNLHLDEVFDMVTEKFCPVLDYYVKSCSNTHNNNNLSHVWRYLIQKNTNFSTLSADTKFILIK